MNLQKLKQIINEYKDKLIIDYPKCKVNRILLKQYKYLFKSISEMIYLVKNYDNLEKLHIFCNCGNKNTFFHINYGYKNFCSKKCIANDKNVQQKRKETMLKTIDENGLNLYQKRTFKMLNNIDENGLNSYQRGAIKFKQKMLNNIDENGLNGYQRMSIKQVQSMYIIDKNGLNKYQKAFLKRKQTSLNNIDKNGLNLFQRATLKGNITKLNNVDVNGFNSFQRATLKRKKTCLKTIDENGLNIFQKINFKSMITKKKNHTFNTSKNEEQVYNYLLQKFNKDDIERQYKSTLYPFNCDFYIKSLNLYIECNFHWTHCPIKSKHKPFKNSAEDLEELEKLKNKNSKYYNIALYVWTKLDPLKLQTFKKNKLNYKIFYNIEHFLNWFNKI